MYTKKDKLISQLQDERDALIYDVVIKSIKDKKESSKKKKFDLMNEFVDFNASLVLPYLEPLLIKMDAIDFILKNHKQINGVFSIHSLLKFGDMYNMTKLFFKIIDFEDLKNKHRLIHAS